MPRTSYIGKLHALDASDLAKVITGVRRCGKSSIMRMVRDQLISAGTPNGKVIYLDLELLSNDPLAQKGAFIAAVKERVERDGAAHLFVDEVQELETWAKTINALRAEYGLNIYVTGSSARMFAGEDITYLSGRYVTVEVHPLSLKEFSQFKAMENPARAEVEAIYDSYVRWGGFLVVAIVPNDELREALLDGICASVFMCDTVLRGGIRNEAAFRPIADFTLDNLGTPTSAAAIGRALKCGEHTVTGETIDSYLDLMGLAYLLYKCQRYDIRRKELLKTNGTHYVVDTGLRNHALGNPTGNFGQVTENIVYLELKRRGFEVQVGTMPQKEVDFVVRCPGGAGLRAGERGGARSGDARTRGSALPKASRRLSARAHHEGCRGLFPGRGRAS